MVIPEAPQNLVGDNAYDSDKLDSEPQPVRHTTDLSSSQQQKKQNPRSATIETLLPSLED
jgi:hypothetical protein